MVGAVELWFPGLLEGVELWFPGVGTVLWFPGVGTVLWFPGVGLTVTVTEGTVEGGVGLMLLEVAGIVVGVLVTLWPGVDTFVVAEALAVVGVSEVDCCPCTAKLLD